MVKLTKEEKEQMLLDAIVLSYRVNNAYPPIFVGRPLSFYDYDVVYKVIKELDDEYIEQGGDSTLDEASRKYVKKFANKPMKMGAGGNIKYELGGL